MKHFRIAGWGFSLVLAAALAARGEGPAPAVVSLAAAAEVHAATIWLSDLLPPEAPPGLRQSGANIELGRSPLPGSPRVLEAAEIVRRLDSYSSLLRQLDIPQRVLIVRSSFSIPRAAIRQAISRRLAADGIGAELGETELPPAAMRSLEENPALKIESLHVDLGRQTLEVGLGCVQSKSCGRFLVSMPAPMPLLAEWKKRGRLPAAAGKEREPGPALTVAGQRATLVLADGRLQIALAVTCLERGVLGQQVRVLDPASHRVITAEVQAAGILLKRF